MEDGKKLSTEKKRGKLKSDRTTYRNLIIVEKLLDTCTVFV